MSLITSMNISQQALLVNQAAISVVSNNISNVNTEGYSRQRVELSPGVNYTPMGGSPMDQVYSSSGVEITSIQRYTDAYLQSYFREQNSTNSYLEQYSEIASNVEGLTNELKGAGLEEAFTKFYESAQTLSLNPQDSVARQNYMQQAQTIALKLNYLSDNFTEIRTSIVGDIGVVGSLEASKIYGINSEANNLLEQITGVNSDIVMMSSSNSPPGSLMDKRDQLIDKLSSLIPLTISENTNGTINLKINGLEIINGTEQVASLYLETGSTAAMPVLVKLKDMDGNVVSNTINSYINSGTMGAVLDIGGPLTTDTLTLAGVMADYDQLASGFASIVNDIQLLANASGTPMAVNSTTMLLQASTEAVFESAGGGPITAGNLKINTDILNDPFLLAVARVNIADYDVKAIGNNSNMLEVLKSRNINSPLLGNAPPESALANIVGSIGLKNANIENNLENQTAVLSQATTQLTSVTGVNMEEELIDLTKYQTAYKASSRVYTVCNELLDLLINLGR